MNAIKEFEIGKIYESCATYKHGARVIRRYKVVDRTWAMISIEPLDADDLLGGKRVRRFRVLELKTEINQAETIAPRGQFGGCEYLTAANEVAA